MTVNFIQRYFDGLTKHSFIPGQAMNEPMFVTWIDSEQERKAADYLRISNSVYFCNKTRAQSLSSLPIRLYRVRNGKRVEVTSGSLYDLLHKVNPFWTAQRLIEMTEMSLGVWGEAFWFLDRGDGGNRRREPQEIWWARSDKVKVVRSKTDYISHYELIPDDGTQPIPFKRDEVVWFRYPNPANEFEGLSPLSAAMLAADAGRAASMANRDLNRNGIQMAGIISPAGGSNMSFTEEQGKQIEQAVNRRFSDPRYAHRWAVLRSQIEFRPLSVTPKDAEFLGALNWSLEEVCRAYGVPIDLVAGQRTYENYNAAQLDLWYRTLMPEARFIANELTEQLLPLFAGQADEIVLDTSVVPVLQAAERERWTTDKEQIASGAMILNEWRKEMGLDPVPWGDVWWAPVGLTPVRDDTDPLESIMTPPSEVEIEEPPADESRMIAAGRTRSMEYGSQEHRAFMERADKRQEPAVKKIGDKTADLMRRQRQSVLAKMRNRSMKRDEADYIEEPFDLPEWIRKFTSEMRPVLRDVLGEAGQEALDDLGVGLSFDVFDPNVVNALEKQVQRFAKEVNETTWKQLKDSLSEGFEAGENVDKLADRVNSVMGERIQSSGETIARTESNIAHSNADLMSWEQSGVVGGKEWLSAIDDRTREAHIAAHGQIVALNARFNVGGELMDGPGIGGSASNVVNCRCTMVAVLDIDMEG